MSLLTQLKTRWNALRHGRRDDGQTAEEIAFHLEMEAAKLRRAGHSPSEATRLARLAFGPVSRTQEEVREARGTAWLDDLVRDVIHAGRQLRRTPGFTSVAVITLALGIGANTAIYSVVDGVLLRPLPFQDADRLVAVWETDRHSGTVREPAAWPDYVDFKARTRTLARIEAVVGADLSLIPDQGEPARVAGVGVTHGYFGTVGIQPLLGRSFVPEEDVPGGPKVALIGESLWRNRFGADRTVVGRQVRLNDDLVTIVGVVPRGADFGLDQLNARAAYHAPYASAGEIDVWLPLQASEERFSRDTHPFLLVGRLAGTATVAAAGAELGGIAAELEREHPSSNRARGAMVESLESVVFGPIRPVLWLLVGTVALVLVVACVNVANLLLARGTTRQREVVVRGALGASVGRLARQFVTEAIFLAVLGGAAGAGIAYGGLAGLLALAPADIPRIAEVSIDLRVLAVTLVVSLGVGVGFGIVPTLQARRLDVAGVIRGEGRGASAGTPHRRARQVLVVAELALSVMLVVGAVLLVRSFGSVLDVDPGFRAAGVLKAEYQLPASRYPRDYSRFPNWVEVQGFHAALLERARAIPGVRAAAIAAAHPLDAGFTNSFVVVGREAEAAEWGEISTRIVSPEYFATLGVEIGSGRAFEPSDDASAPPVALVNKAAVEKYFPRQNPIGQQIRFWGLSRRIVGVVGDEKVRGLTEAAPPSVYIALAQAPPSTGVLLLRTDGAPALLASPVRQAIWSIDRELAIFGVEPLLETLNDSVGQRRFVMLVLGGFAFVALALALVGVYGVLSYTTSQRTRELGIRSALGASRGAVAGLVVRGGMALAVTGVTIGLLGAAVFSRVLSGLLYGTGATDPLTYLLVSAAVLGSAAVATWVPARRAARVQPVEVLRGE